MNEATFNIGPGGEMTLDAWLRGGSPHALVVQLPAIRGVGEDEFLLYVAEARRKCCGYKDSLRRHFISRRFGIDGTPSDADALLCEASLVAEITDEFYGVDAIDLTEWLHAPMSGERWHSLVRHIQSSPHTDFVLLARSSFENDVDKLARVIGGMGCMPVEQIRLYPPSGEMLASRMAAEASGSIDGATGLASSLFVAMQEVGSIPNYILAKELGLQAENWVRRGVDPKQAVTAVFEGKGMRFGYQI